MIGNFYFAIYDKKALIITTKAFYFYSTDQIRSDFHC